MKNVLSVFLLCFTVLAHAEVIHAEAWDFYLDIPDDLIFEDIQNAGEKLTLRDDHGVYQLRVYPGGEIERLVAAHLAEWGLPASAVQRFRYNDRPAATAELSLEADDGRFLGYAFWIARESSVIRLAALTPQSRFDQDKYKLLSFIDSFAPNTAERFLPGPVSQFRFPRGEAGLGIQWSGMALSAVLGSNWTQAEQAVIDREAVVLSRFPARQPDRIARAWSRFYRMIYRETRAHLELFARQLARLYESRRLPRTEWPRALLKDLQGFTYQRRSDASDIDASGTVLTQRSGDCDSLALVYLAVLDHWGIEGILMVSQVYGHALAAVDLSGNGARFAFEGRQWLVAELTANVELGMIDSEMADPRKWLGIDLKKEP